MKKLLIVLLFFGFSFGQDIESKLIGTWKTVKVNQSYIFLKNGTGYWSWINKNNEDMNSKFSWSVLLSETEISLGTLIIDFDNLDFKMVRTFTYSSKEFIKEKEGILEIYPEGINWNGGDILVWWDSKLKSPTSYTLLERY